jgi:hypothetical protein
MADIIGFPREELSPEEQKQLEEFLQEELEDIQDTSCESYKQIQAEIAVMVEYFQQFMAVVKDSKTKVNPDIDFGLFLLEGRVRKIRGMLESLFGDQ